MNTPDHEYESEIEDCDNWPTNEEERKKALEKETYRIKKAQQSAKERFGK